MASTNTAIGSRNQTLSSSFDKAFSVRLWERLTGNSVPPILSLVIAAIEFGLGCALIFGYFFPIQLIEYSAINDSVLFFFSNLLSLSIAQWFWAGSSFYLLSSLTKYLFFKFDQRYTQLNTILVITISLFVIFISLWLLSMASQ